MLMHTTRATMVLLEPGAPPNLALAPSEQNYVLLLGPHESPDQFRDRVRQRADSLRRQARILESVTYLVGETSQADWPMRRGLLSDLCSEMAPDGSVAVLAPASASSDVLGCLGDLQASVARQRELRAVFVDAAGHPADGAEQS
jgi:hypothetical protein